MQCLQCGKKLSLLRKLSDGKFCSDAHREAYHRQQDHLALARLIESQTGKAPAKIKAPARKARGKSEAIPAFAPMLPQAAVWARWSRLACPQLAPESPRARLHLPESGLRPAVRGFPSFSAAEWPPAVRLLFNALDTGSDYELPAAPPFLGPAAAVDPLAETAEVGVPPVQPLRVAAVPPVRARGGGVPGKGSPRLLERRKMVVIVPKSGLEPRRGWSLPAKPARVTWEVGPIAAGRKTCVYGPAQGADGGAVSPALCAVLAPPAWLQPESPARAAEGPSPRSEAPPVCVDLVRLPAPLPLLARESSHQEFSAGPEFPGAAPAAALPQQHSEPALCQLRIQPALPHHDARIQPGEPTRCRDLSLEWLPVKPVSQWPDIRLAPVTERPGWPLFAGRTPEAVSAAAGQVKVYRSEPAPVEEQIEPALVPVLAAHLALRQLRPCWRLVRLPALAPVLTPAVACGTTAWIRSGAGAAIPPARLDLQPPEPPEVLRRPEPEEATAAGLRALEEAVSRPPLSLGGEQLPPEQAALPLSPSGQAGEAAAPLPPQAPPMEGGQDPELGLIPPPCRRLPIMPVRPKDCPATLAAPDGATVCACWPSLDDPHPALPGMRLQLDHADGSGPRREAAQRARRRKAAQAPRKRFWAHAPSDLKWIAVALPLLLIVVVYSFRTGTPNNPSGEPAVTSAVPAPQAAAPGAPAVKVNALQRFIMRRAGVRLFDDFRAGLASWQGREGWAKTWRYGDATFVEPGELALLSPSIGLSDYTLTFLGQIERRSLNWVFRATDTANYYSMRIVVTRGGPLPEAMVVRSVTINGRERDVKSLPIPFPVKADTLYLVRMEVRGQDFTTYIQDQLVDHFSDARLRSGGVGFYSPRGDRALLRWVEVSHQYDYLGRLCALLSPYSVQSLAGD